MPDLLPFATRHLGSEAVNTVNARHLYAYLEMSGDYSLWIKRAIKRANLVENVDFIINYQVVENPTRGRPASEHHLTFDAAKHVAMMSSATKGHEVREWFIQKEKELISNQGLPPQVKNPSNQLLIDSIVRLDEVEQRAIAAEQRALIAETKADLALEDARRMTLEDFILKNGLLRQFPLTNTTAYTAWLKTFCRDYGLEIQKAPVMGKPWTHENAYQLSALSAWLRYETRRPTQVHLVPK